MPSRSSTSSASTSRTARRRRPPPRCSQPRSTIPLRGAVTFKSTVGLNVASDALANLSSGGVTGRRADHPRRGLRRGLEHHAGARPRVRDEVADVAARSAAERRGDRRGRRARLRALRGEPTPRCMLDLRLRSCHLHGSFVAKDNRRPAMSVTRRDREPQTRRRPDRAAARELRPRAGEDRRSAGRPPSASSRSAGSTSSSTTRPLTSGSSRRAGSTTP